MNIPGKKFYISERLFLTITFLFLFLLNAGAQQQPQFLSLNDAVANATSGNNQVRSARIDEAIAKEKYLQTNAGFLPQLNFSYSGVYSDNPLNIFGFKLQQRDVTAADFSPDKMNHPSATSDFTTKLELQQPIINMDAVYARRSAQAQMESFQLKTERTREGLEFETRKAYRQLQQAYQVITVLEDALNTAKSMYEFTDNRARQGLIQESDVLNAHVQVLNIESNLNEAKSNVANASDYLSVLMNKPSGTVYSVEEMKDSSSEKISQASLPDNRADFLALEKGKEATGLMMQSLKKKYVPRLNAFGSYQLNDKKLYGFNANSYLAGIQLTWNIFDGNQNRRQANQLKLEQDKLDVQLQSMKQEDQMKLDKGYRDLENANFKIRTQKAAIRQADDALQILRNRFDQGLVNTTDVLMAQTQVAQQKLNLTMAVFNQQVAQDYIQFLTKSDNQQ